jgi:subtilase family serine protease
MSRPLQVIGILIVLFISIVGIASASISVGTIALSPSGDLVSGQTQSSASFTVNFGSSGGYTFDNSNTLQMETELADATWSYNVILDGIENPAKTEVGPNIRLSGWELSYPSSREISLKVKVTGTAPVVTNSTEKIVMRVRELSSSNTLIGTEVVKKKMVLNPATIGETLQSESARMSRLRQDLDQLAGSGIDLTAAEAKYGQATAYLQSAEKATDITRKQSDLSAAKKLLNEIEDMVLVMGAQHAISTAEGSIGQTEQLITYFKVNKSMGSDSRLMPIVARWEIAADKLSDARDLYTEGKYAEAANKASEAATKGDEVLNDAQALKDKVDSNPLSGIVSGLSGAISGTLVTIVIIIVIAIIAVVGIVLFRKRRKWDELG